MFSLLPLVLSIMPNFPLFYRFLLGGLNAQQIREDTVASLLTQPKEGNFSSLFLFLVNTIVTIWSVDLD